MSLLEVKNLRIEYPSRYGVLAAVKDLSFSVEKGEIVGVEIPIANCCPCSKAISEYGAHNQRTYLRAKTIVDVTPGCKKVWIEELVEKLEAAASCPVFPVLKRQDEKWVTEKQYDNPKFVEDVIRDATLILRTIPEVRGFSLEVEALESIHGHNAWAAHKENFD